MLSGTFEGLQKDDMLNITAISDIASSRLTHEILAENTYIDDEGEFPSKFG